MKGVEREIKLNVPQSFSMPPLDGPRTGLRASDRGVHRLEATYWDTPSMALFRRGIGLRHRITDSERGVWTLKADGRREGHAVVRSETDIAGPPDAPPPALRELLPEDIDAASLRPVARISTERHLTDLFDDGDVRWAEVADDRVAVLRDHAVVDTFREVEVEITGADDDVRSDAIVATLLAAGAQDGGGRGKHSRALEALGLLPQRT